jgi:hypothetical protein
MIVLGAVMLIGLVLIVISLVAGGGESVCPPPRPFGLAESRVLFGALHAGGRRCEVRPLTRSSLVASSPHPIGSTSVSTCTSLSGTPLFLSNPYLTRGVLTAGGWNA